MSKSLGNTTARVSRAELKSERIKVLAKRQPLTIEPQRPIAAALDAMRRGEGEPLLVCEGPRLVGIVTERDVLLKVLAREIDRAQPVETIMTRDPETAGDQTTVLEALQMMDRGGYRNLPIVDAAGRLVGMLRQQDLLEYVAEAFPQEILNLPPRPHQRMEQAEGG